MRDRFTISSHGSSPRALFWTPSRVCDRSRVTPPPSSPLPPPPTPRTSLIIAGVLARAPIEITSENDRAPIVTPQSSVRYNVSDLRGRVCGNGVTKSARKCAGEETWRN